MQSLNTLRRSEITVFCAYIAFVVAGLTLFGLVDDSPFIVLMDTHIELAAVWYAIEAGSAIALLVVGIGALPIGIALLRYAWANNRSYLVLLAAPPLAFVMLVATAIGLFSIFGPLPSEAVNPESSPPIQVVIFGVLFSCSAIASTVAVCIAVTRSQVEEQTYRLPGITITVQPYRFAFLPAAIATLSMGLMLAATVAWGLIARAEAPQVFNSNATAGWWLGIAAAMAVATAVAGGAVVKAWSVQGIAQTKA